MDNPNIPLDIASYKLYYVNYEIDLEFPSTTLRHFPQGQERLLVPSNWTKSWKNQSNYLVGAFRGFTLRQLVLNILFQQMRIGSH